MLKFCLYGLVCFGLFVTGCGTGVTPPPSKEEADKLNAAMDTDMKTMMQQIPQSPNAAK